MEYVKKEIGELEYIMEDWKEVKLSDVCLINTQSYSKNDNYEYVNYLDTGNLTENSVSEIQRIDLSTEELPSRAKRKVQVNSILYSTVRPNQKHFGIIKNVPENFLVSTGFAVIDVVKDKADPFFLYYFLTRDEITTKLHAIAEQSTSAYPSIKPTDILDLEINLPPLPTQQKIAQILSSLDDKIELNNKINANLEQQAQALFKSWFVDFEPFGGEMPAGWRNTTLDSFCNIFTGRKNANASVENGQYKFFTCSPNPLPIDSFIFDGDAIIVSGNGAYTGRTRFYSGKFDLYQRTYACTMKEDINPEYVYLLYWIVKFVLSKKIMGGTHGSAIPYIVMDDIAKFEIRYDEKTFEELSKIMKSIVLQIQDNENQNEKLTTLRDTLLPKLMSGELEVN